MTRRSANIRVIVGLTAVIVGVGLIGLLVALFWSLVAVPQVVAADLPTAYQLIEGETSAVRSAGVATIVVCVVVALVAAAGVIRMVKVAQNGATERLPRGVAFWGSLSGLAGLTLGVVPGWLLSIRVGRLVPEFYAQNDFQPLLLVNSVRLSLAGVLVITLVIATVLTIRDLVRPERTG